MPLTEQLAPPDEGFRVQRFGLNKPPLGLSQLGEGSHHRLHVRDRLVALVSHGGQSLADELS